MCTLIQNDWSATVYECLSFHMAVTLSGEVAVYYLREDRARVFSSDSGTGRENLTENQGFQRENLY